MNFRNIHSEDATWFITRNVTGGVSLMYPRISGGAWTTAYEYTQVIPDHPYATDYAANQHRLSFNFGNPLAPRFSAVINTSIEYRTFKNFDTNSQFALGKKTKRQTLQASIGARVSYELHSRLSLFADSNFSLSKTTLNAGYIYDPEGNPVGIQSLVFSDFWLFNAGAGMQFRF